MDFLCNGKVCVKYGMNVEVVEIDLKLVKREFRSEVKVACRTFVGE